MGHWLLRLDTPQLHTNTRCHDFPLFCFYPSLCLQPLTNTWRVQVKPQMGPPVAVTSSGLTPVPVSLKAGLPRVPGDCPVEQP